MRWRRRRFRFPPPPPMHVKKQLLTWLFFRLRHSRHLDRSRMVGPDNFEPTRASGPLESCAVTGSSVRAAPSVCRAETPTHGIAHRCVSVGARGKVREHQASNLRVGGRHPASLGFHASFARSRIPPGVPYESRKLASSSPLREARFFASSHETQALLDRCPSESRSAFARRHAAQASEGRGCAARASRPARSSRGVGRRSPGPTGRGSGCRRHGAVVSSGEAPSPRPPGSCAPPSDASKPSSPPRSGSS
jgi:hypothetical protein